MNQTANRTVERVEQTRFAKPENAICLNHQLLLDATLLVCRIAVVAEYDLQHDFLEAVMNILFRGGLSVAFAAKQGQSLFNAHVLPIPTVGPLVTEGDVVLDAW